ncbi:MAG TPA: hypothetical protein VF575_01315 [Candidatus Saccharimonadales bacterium]
MKETVVHVDVIPIPVKGRERDEMPFAQIEAQAEINRSNLVEVDYHSVPSTCSDERPHENEARPSVFGGSDVYALAIGELTGQFAGSKLAAKERLIVSKQTINDAKLLSGGHVNCAAATSFEVWMTSIHEQPENIIPYVRQEIGDDYDDDMMQEVIANAARATDNGTYADFSEETLRDVLGDEAELAIERVGNVPHEGVTLAKNKVNGKTIDQTAVYEQSVAGRGTFDFDEAYAQKIEDAVTSGPEAVRLQKLAHHAREAVIAAISGAVPNDLIYQITISE